MNSVKNELKECINKLNNYTKTTDEVINDKDELKGDIDVLKEQIQNINNKTENLTTLIENLKQDSTNKEKEINDFITSHYDIM